MSKDKVKIKTKKPKKSWAEEWCRERAIELFTFYRDYVITLHPVHGIVGVASGLENALLQEQFLRRSIAAECMHVDVNAMIAKVRPGLQVMKRPDSPNMDPYRQEAETPVPEKAEPPPHLADPFDNSDVILDGSPHPSDVEASDVGTFNPTETLAQVAQRLGKKATEVLLKVLAWPDDERPTGVHINTHLTAEQVKRIEDDFKNEKPFPSPDKQPPFMPRRSPLEGSVRLDGVSNPGARGSWGRGLRYD